MTTYNLDFEKDVVPGTFDSTGDVVTYLFSLSNDNSESSPWTNLVITDFQLGINNVAVASIAGLKGDTNTNGLLDKGEV